MCELVIGQSCVYEKFKNAYTHNLNKTLYKIIVKLEVNEEE